MIMKIFDDFVRTDLSLKNTSQSDYEYLNKSARLPTQLLRQIINGWFEEYKQEIKDSNKINDLKKRLQSKKDDQHQHIAAFFELYMFILLKRLGFVIVAEPSIHGCTTKPDFLATCSKTGKGFYLEATTVTEGDDNNKRDKAIWLVADKINKKIQSDSRAIRLDWYGICSEHDITKEVINKIKNWINTNQSENPINFSFKNWFLCLTAIKISSPFERIVANIGNIKVQSLNHKTDINIDTIAENRMDATSRIQDAISEKAKKYGQLDKPYVIAINMKSHYFNRNFLFEALFGREVTHFYEDGKIVEARLDDGIWQKYKETISTSVNGVLSFFSLSPWTVFMPNKRSKDEKTFSTFVNNVLSSNNLTLNENSKSVPLFPLNPYVKDKPLPLELTDLLDENSCLLDLKKLQNIMNLPEEEWEKALEKDDVC